MSEPETKSSLIDSAKLGIAARRLDSKMALNMAAETESLVYEIEALRDMQRKQIAWEHHAKAVIMDRESRIADLEAEAQIRADRAAKRKRKASK